MENHWSERGGAAAADNQVPPQAPVEAMAIPVNPAGLTNAYVRASLAQMENVITMQAQAMTDQVNRYNVQRENPTACSIADKVYEFRGSSGVCG